MNGPTSIDAMLRSQAMRNPDKRFVTCGEASYTYAQMERAADALAKGLFAHGVSPGDRVAIISPNRPEMLELYFACARLGAIQVPLNIYLRGEFLAHQLEDCIPTALVTDAAGLQASLPILSRLPELTIVVLLDDESTQADISQHVMPFRAVAAAGSSVADRSVPRPQPQDTMELLYTSGTTGSSKGCVISNGYSIRAGHLGAQLLALSPDEHLITALPLFHGGARLVGLVGALVCGSSLSILPEFRASTFLKDAAALAATVTLGVGAMAMALLAQPPGPPDTRHTIRRAVCGPLTAEHQADFESRFGIEVSAGIFGQTECVPIAFAPPDGLANPMAVGAPAPDLEVAILDDCDQPLPAGEVGEIAIRPRHRYAMFDGYWNNAQATVDGWRGLWHHTGDYGRLDTTGLLYFVDRKKDSLRRRGENVSSVEVETAISRHPKVAAVAVHAVPSDVGEDDIKACIVLEQGKVTSPEEMFAYFVAELPYFAVPRYVEVLTELPLNAMLRVMKYQLRQRGVTQSTWDLDAIGLAVERGARRHASSSC
jgi:carnitine-CoA ligase